MTRSATVVWCPKCEAFQPCKSRNLNEWPSILAYGDIHEEDGRHLCNTKHEDICWSRRLRLCEECGQGFLTGELHEDLIDELAEIRDSLEKVIAAVDGYKAIQQEARKALSKLTRIVGNVKK